MHMPAYLAYCVGAALGLAWFVSTLLERAVSALPL